MLCKAHHTGLQTCKLKSCPRVDLQHQSNEEMSKTFEDHLRDLSIVVVTSRSIYETSAKIDQPVCVMQMLGVGLPWF